MALKLPQGRMPSNRGPQPSPDRSVRSGDLREGCWTRPATGKTREERVSSAGRELRGQRPRRHTHRPPACSPARSLWFRAAPWPLRAPSRRNARTEPVSAFLRLFPPSLAGPGLSPAGSPGGAGRLFTGKHSQRLRPLHRLPRDCSKLGRQGRGRGREGQGAGSDVTRGGAGESTPRTGFPVSPWDT